jgi:hypothetical protein
MSQVIYVELLNEGVEVWVPVKATLLDDGTFQLPATSPDDQEWALSPGSRVRCEQQGDDLVAVSLAG